MVKLANCMHILNLYGWSFGMHPIIFVWKKNILQTNKFYKQILLTDVLGSE